MWVQSLPSEGPLLSALKEHAKGPGMYLFPYETDPAKMEASVQQNPRGLLTLIPAGVPFSFGAKLGIQCGNDILVGLLLAWLLSKAAPQLAGLPAKIAFAAALALFASIGYLAPFWNWYAFAPMFVLAGTADSIIASALGAVAIAKIMRWQ
ncbi:MAG: hypothetical protein FJW40_22950 [Acidobacteria bacterium]|nr:hypothetical protein [Acidobacteriota bacterium]